MCRQDRSVRQGVHQDIHVMVVVGSGVKPDGVSDIDSAERESRRDRMGVVDHVEVVLPTMIVLAISQP